MSDDDVYNYLTIHNGGKCKYCGSECVTKIGLTDFAKTIISIIPNTPDEMFICGSCRRFQFSDNGIKRNTIHRFD